MSDDNSHSYDFDYPAISKSETFTIVLGSICALFPASVVFILLHRYEKLMKGRRLIHYILMIAIADTIISFISLGYPKPHTTTCAVQGHHHHHYLHHYHYHHYHHYYHHYISFLSSVGSIRMFLYFSSFM